MIIILHITLIQQFLLIIYLMFQDVVHHYHYNVLFGVLIKSNSQELYIMMELIFSYQVILIIGKKTTLYLIVKSI